MSISVFNKNKKKKEKKKASSNKLDADDSHTPSLPHLHPPPSLSFEGESLLHLLHSLQRKLDSARALDATTLPLKIWLKQQFSIGVNDVTRSLERMPPLLPTPDGSQQFPRQSPPHVHLQLQVILLATDCYPRSLTRHLPSLASSRKVPLIFVKDSKGGSLKLGGLVKLKTAIAIGVKAKRNNINQFIEEIISGHEVYDGVQI